MSPTDQHCKFLCPWISPKVKYVGQLFWASEMFGRKIPQERVLIHKQKEVKGFGLVFSLVY